MHRFDVQTIKNVELRRKPFKTAKLQKWSNWTSKRSKMLSYVANHSKPLNYKSDQIGRLNDLKCWVTSQNIQNNAKLQEWSKNNDFTDLMSKTSKQRKTTKIIKLHELHRFNVQTIKTTQNYKTDQISMNCMHLTSKRTKMLRYVANHSKQRKTTKVIKIQWLASIWRQNDLKCRGTSQNIQNNTKLQK